MYRREKGKTGKEVSVLIAAAVLFSGTVTVSISADGPQKFLPPQGENNGLQGHGERPRDSEWRHRHDRE